LSSVLQSFLHSRLPVPGLLGWGVRFPDRRTDTHSLANFLHRAQVEQALSRALALAETLPQHHLAPTLLRWRFDQMTICLGLRPDQYCLFLLLARSEGNADFSEGLLTDFQTLSLGD